MSDEYSNSCRFCLNFVETFNRTELTDLIREQIRKDINIALKTSNVYPGFYCDQCSQELRTCLVIREKFAKNQKILEEHFKTNEDENKDDILNFLDVKTEEYGEDDEIKLEPEIEIETDNKLSSDESSESEDNLEKSDSTDSTSQTEESEDEIEDRVKCSDCNKYFKRENLKKHKIRFHSNKKRKSKKPKVDRKYDCDEEDCNKKFLSSSDLINHKKIVHGEPVQCSICQKILSCEYSLKRHKKTHMDDYVPVKKSNCKTIPCQDCGKLFRTDNIKKHYERIHLKLREYQCDVCSKSFFAKARLEDHIKSHNDVKEEECPKCGMKFNQKGTLYAHIKVIHENRYVKTCERCGKSEFFKSFI